MPRPPWFPPTIGLLFGTILALIGWHGARRVMSAFRPGHLLATTTVGLPVGPDSVPTVVFVFRPDECPRLMSVLDILNHIPPSDARVVGALTVEEYRFPAWRELVRAEDIRFPVARIAPTAVRRALSPLGYGAEPLLLLFDPAGRLVFATEGLDRPGLRSLLGELIRVNGVRGRPPPPAIAVP